MISAKKRAEIRKMSVVLLKLIENDYPYFSKNISKIKINQICDLYIRTVGDVLKINSFERAHYVDMIEPIFERYQDQEFENQMWIFINKLTNYLTNHKIGNARAVSIYFAILLDKLIGYNKTDYLSEKTRKRNAEMNNSAKDDADSALEEMKILQAEKAFVQVREFNNKINEQVKDESMVESMVENKVESMIENNIRINPIEKYLIDYYQNGRKAEHLIYYMIILNDAYYVHEIEVLNEHMQNNIEMIGKFEVYQLPIKLEEGDINGEMRMLAEYQALEKFGNYFNQVKGF